MSPVTSPPTRPSARPAASDDLSSALRIVVARLGRRLRVERPSDVLPAGMVAVLGTLHGSGAVRISALAVTENVRPPSMTRTVSSLAEQGLVERASLRAALPVLQRIAGA